MGSLENHILISMPHLQDPYFKKSIVLICEHSNDGALGLIINKAFEKPQLKLLFDNIDHEHYNYWSLTSLKNFFNQFNEKIFRSERIKTHAPSLRV